MQAWLIWTWIFFPLNEIYINQIYNCAVAHKLKLLTKRWTFIQLKQATNPDSPAGERNDGTCWFQIDLYTYNKRLLIQHMKYRCGQETRIVPLGISYITEFVKDFLLDFVPFALIFLVPKEWPETIFIELSPTSLIFILLYFLRT